MFSEPAVKFDPASRPTAVLKLPLLLNIASSPMATFAPPETLLNSAKEPKAALAPPLSLSRSALIPTAVLSVPLVLKNIAAVPTAVLSAASLKNSVPAPRPVLKKVAPVLVKDENHPKAELKALAEFSRALNPSAVLLLTGKGDGSGLSGPPAPNASPKQASTEKIVVNIVKLLRFFINLIFLLLFDCFGLL